MALPIAKAMDLAKDMKKKGIAGEIGMVAPKHMGSGDAMDDSPEKDPMSDVDPAIEKIAGDIIDKVKAGDQMGLAECLQELLDRSSSEPDGDEGSS